MKRIYLDNAATTNIDPKVIEAMNESYRHFGNPSSIHTHGQESRKIIDNARASIANFLNCKPTEIVFTSGGSEADNLVIRGIIDSATGSFDSLQSLRMTTKPHVVTTAIEHHAVLHTIQDLEREGKIEATYVKPDRNGIIQVGDIESAIKSNTVLVSVMYANNEVGTVQPIREIGEMIEAKNKQIPKLDPRVKPEDDKVFEKIYFHTDAVQAAAYLEMAPKYLHVDLLTLTAHKFHGPKGVGVLFVKKGTPISPVITGGDQEFRLRAGTENVAGVVGLAVALQLIIKERADGGKIDKNAEMDPACPVFRDDSVEKVERLRNKLEEGILNNIPETYLNGDKKKRVPNISNISFKNAEGEAIILNLDFLGIAVSSGSACTARSLEPSHVLSAMEVPHTLSHGAIRFSLSRETTEEEIDKVLEELPNIIAKLRQMSPFN